MATPRHRSAAPVSGGEPPAVAWRRSSHSTAANNCVETARLGSGRMAVRDSKDPLGPVLLFAPAAWADFVQAVSAGSGPDTGLGPA